jgi:hypothetical protein
MFGEHKIVNLVTAGARLGYAWDRLLIFATGGFASANVENAHCSSITGMCGGPGSAGNGASSGNHGWYAGGGTSTSPRRARSASFPAAPYRPSATSTSAPQATSCARG